MSSKYQEIFILFSLQILQYYILWLMLINDQDNDNLLIINVFVYENRLSGGLKDLEQQGELRRRDN